MEKKHENMRILSILANRCIILGKEKTGNMGKGDGNMRRVIWIVLDSVGMGEAPDAADFDDVGCNTIGHIMDYRPDLRIPASATGISTACRA